MATMSSVTAAGAQVTPTRRFNLFGGQVTIHMFGRLISDQECSRIWRNERVRKFLCSYASANEIERIFATSVHDTNARIVAGQEGSEPDQFSECLVHNGVEFRFGPGEVNRPEQDGICADGVKLLRPGDGVCVSTADCPLLFLNRPDNTLVVAHAALNSLLDRKWLDSERTALRRDYEGVVQAGLHGLSKEDRRLVRSGLYCGIAPQPFSHPLDHENKERAKSNRLLVEFLESLNRNIIVGARERGCVNLSQFTKVLLEAEGVPTDPLHFSTDHIDTYSDKNGDSFEWSSNRRDPHSGRNVIFGTWNPKNS